MLLFRRDLAFRANGGDGDAYYEVRMSLMKIGLC